MDLRNRYNETPEEAAARFLHIERSGRGNPGSALAAATRMMVQAESIWERQFYDIVIGILAQGGGK